MTFLNVNAENNYKKQILQHLNSFCKSWHELSDDCINKIVAGKLPNQQTLLQIISEEKSLSDKICVLLTPKNLKKFREMKPNQKP